MTQFLDLFGFLSVVLRACTLAFQSLSIGGVVFALMNSRARGMEDIDKLCRRMVVWWAVALAVTQLCYVAAHSVILIETTDLGLAEVAGANFFLAGSTTVVLALLLAALQTSAAARARTAAIVVSTGILAASVATSHAAGRLENQGLLWALTALHYAGTACWIGGLPYLLLALGRVSGTGAARGIASRFSRLAQIGVTALFVAGLGLAIAYVGSPAAVYGTSYGAMVGAKISLFFLLLVLGTFNFIIVRGVERGDGALMNRLRRFVEAEVGIGFTGILVAASLTSQPPAVDLATSRLTFAELEQRVTPAWPRLKPPAVGEMYPKTLAVPSSGLFESFVPGQLYSPVTPDEIALSEFNHNWSGLIVLLAGLLSLGARAGLPWARSWPLTFMVLAVFVFFMADADYWPLGPLNFWKGFQVSEVLLHRMVVPLIAAFAVCEWRVQTGRSKSPKLALVFPVVCALGSALLLTHTHSLNNAKEEVFAELSHVPIALCGVMAGWSRWLEVRVSGGPRKVLSWIWPVCFALVGAILLNYREH